MVNDSIIFLCTACRTKLTVPWEMAGVVGPCPICQTEIQAPYPLLEPTEVPAVAEPDPIPARPPVSTPVAEVEARNESAVGTPAEVGVAQQVEDDFGFEKKAFGEIDEEIVVETTVEAGREHATRDVEQFVPVALAEGISPLVERAEVEFFGQIDDVPAAKITPAALVVEEIKIPITPDKLFWNPEDDFVPNFPLGVQDKVLRTSIVEPQLTTVSQPIVEEVTTDVKLPPPAFPKTPPPFPQGLESVQSPRPAVALAIHPSLATPQIIPPPVGEMTVDEPLVSPLLAAESIKEMIPAAALAAAKTLDFPASPDPKDEAPKSAPSRPLIRTLPENMKQIPIKRGPTTAYPEPRRAPAGRPPSEFDPGPAATSDDSEETGNITITGVKRRSHRQSRAIKILVIALFLALLAGTFAVLWTLKNRQAADALRKDLKSKQLTQSASPAEALAPVLVKPKIEPPASEVATQAPPVEPELSTPARAALKVLEKFLGAQTLAERMPLIETKTPEEELMISCLASALPKVAQVSIEIAENNQAKQFLDHFYHVEFENSSMEMPSVTVLVRTRGTAEPKVVIDPFLDSFGGRITAYASKPSNKAATFQTIIWPLAACYDTKVPNRIDKLTFKLLAKDDTKEIVLAYFARDSQIAKLLEDDSHRLSYGKAQIATINLIWNTNESRSEPFLEVLEVKTLDWDP